MSTSRCARRRHVAAAVQPHARLALGALAGLGIVVGAVLGVSDNVTIADRINFVNAFGLASVLPVATFDLCLGVLR